MEASSIYKWKFESTRKKHLHKKTQPKNKWKNHTSFAVFSVKIFFSIQSRVTTCGLHEKKSTSHFVNFQSSSKPHIQLPKLFPNITFFCFRFLLYKHFPHSTIFIYKMFLLQMFSLLKMEDINKKYTQTYPVRKLEKIFDYRYQQWK